MRIRLGCAESRRFYLSLETTGHPSKPLLFFHGRRCAAQSQGSVVAIVRGASARTRSAAASLQIAEPSATIGIIAQVSRHEDRAYFSDSRVVPALTRSLYEANARLNHLRTFLAIARSGKLTTAVRRLKLTHSPLSRYIVRWSAPSIPTTSSARLPAYDTMREATNRLYNATNSNVAASVWSQVGTVSVYKMQPQDVVLFEFRTGLISLMTAAAPKVFMAYLPLETTVPLLEHELEQRRRPKQEARELTEQYRSEVEAKGYAMATYLGDLGDEIVALSAPVFDARDQIALTLTLVDHSERVHPRTCGYYLQVLLETAHQTSEIMVLG